MSHGGITHKGPPHTGVRQGVEDPHRVEDVPGSKAKPFLVDASETRRKAMEPQQLSYGCHPGPGRCRRHPRAHTIQGYLLPHLGGSFLGEGLRIRRVHEVQEAYQCPAIRSEPDPEPSLHTVVVTDHQPRQCVRRVPSAARPDWDLHARKDSDTENLVDSDLPGALMAEGSRERCHGECGIGLSGVG
eukprot:751248-Amorphochlora_amoeboformis.AAC.1